MYNADELRSFTEGGGGGGMYSGILRDLHKI